ncbi:hypothetical protein LIER_07429 [Lithospermum erythrorhizon]|uniref:Uncharacterized protein n=1 Tax=Lithospermum erythrorhizon TaxID=34254 RepID=A0AAV3PCR6_LITER
MIQIARPQLQLSSHGKVKKFRLFKNRSDPTLSPHDSSRPQLQLCSHAGKRKEIFEDEVDSIEDRNCKHVRSRMTVSPSKVPSGGDIFLQSTNETLDGDVGLNSEDLEILESLMGDLENEEIGEQASSLKGIKLVMLLRR